MARTLPAPPPGVTLSPVANMGIGSARDWLRDALGVDVTTRYLKAATDARELRCQIVAGRRAYATTELYRFLVTRPERTSGRGGRKAATK